MAKDELLDSRVSVAQCKKTIDTIHQYASKKAAKAAETELLGPKEEYIWLTIALKKAPATSSFKPIKMCVLLFLCFYSTN